MADQDITGLTEGQVSICSCTITVGWNHITENPRGLFFGILHACYTHPRHRDESTILLQRVYYVPKKVHHSLLHTSVGECSLACIYNNEVETSHTASQNPQSSWDMQQCNISSAGGRRGYDTGLWHTASLRGASSH